MWHGPGPAASTVNTVVWRYRGQERSGFDLHASWPYRTLFDTALLMPAIGMVKTSAKQQVCASGLRQFAMAMLQYTTDNEGITPTTYMIKGQESGLIETYFDSKVVTASSGSFLADTATFCKCPEVRAYFLAQGKVVMGMSGNTAAYAPFYGISTYVPLNKGSALSSGIKNNLNVLSLIRRTSQTGFMFCGDAQWQTATGVDGALRRYPMRPHRAKLGFLVQPVGGSGIPRPAALDGTCNVSFFDGQIATRQLQDPTGGLSDFDDDKFVVVSTQNSGASVPADVAGLANAKWLTFWKGNGCSISRRAIDGGGPQRITGAPRAVRCSSPSSPPFCGLPPALLRRVPPSISAGHGAISPA